MDLRDLIKKMDSIENPETGQKKRIDEGAALSIYGDTPEDINAMAQIFRSAGVTPPPAIVVLTLSAAAVAVGIVIVVMEVLPVTVIVPSHF